MSTWPPISELVPHAPPMILIDRMLDWAPGEARCELTVREGAPFVREGRVHAVVGIETMAQTVAACLGYEAFTGGGAVRVGVIIGCRRLDILRPWVPVGTRLVISARRVRGNEMLSHFECEVADGEDLVATSLLTLYHAEAPPD
ncbi:MAG: 3-hydroxylacyl-ACP dehydratase [Deltaproteobacteria bacterium]|nr:3-hydroxylacyl-ACP dehydratase [Deltaproteobacteria bacterium]MCB9786242.1 3-hydroxylacyl-ACP dehydratase [Deltaproteobacteria bacterium]